MQSTTTLDPDVLRQFCVRHGVCRLAVFGSALRGTDRSDSDIDFLVEFAPGAVPGLMGMAALEIELGPLLGGRKVDLRTANDLSRHFRDEVMREAEVQYAGG